ncbi:D-alanyl-D-alanine carboxypeptidase/D-alanyl-D-alanine-endopeptidase [Rhodobacteraceae bacterium KMM 6894]|nr:D-alanyl-D-alanine carboxypeptidase/D-alanyl-D-alanine-endopeptidase [Rhodobacteraceae bacterium KMM 6894]
MLKMVSRRLFLGGAATSALASGAFAGAPSVSLRPQLRPEGLKRNAARPSAPEAQTLIERAKLGGRVGYAVIDVGTGTVLEARDARAGFPPASVAKAITTLYALEALGDGYRFRTQLVATGPLENGIIKGDLVLTGGGDPTLDTNALADMAADLKAAGVHSVTGDFRIFSGALPYEKVIDPAQPDQVGYNPALSGLNLNFNRVHFQWVRAGSGYTVTMDARSNKYRPDVTVSRMEIKNRASPLYTYRDAGDHDQWTVAQGALGGSGSRWLPVRHPANYAGEVFAYFARAQGLKLNGPKVQRTAPVGTALVTHQSVRLTTILRDMLKYSNNLTAELVGMTATAARRGTVGSLAESGREMSGWARGTLGLSDAALVDHSGLGAASRIGPESLARALAGAYGNNILSPLLKPFSMRDAKGGVNKNHPVKVLAKTGTLHFVSALAGYATGPRGRPLAFVIFAANEDLRKGLETSSQDRPPGSASWNKRAKILQQALIERWDAVYTG